MISEALSQILGLPNYHIDTYNSLSILNYWCLIEPVIAATGVESICEVGSATGDTSKHIIDYIAGNEISFHIVDPVAKEFLDELAGASIFIHRQTSLEFLDQAERCDLYILDGDHNYWTVSRELEAIHAHSGQNRPLVVMMHDTSWPHARRDSYYACGDVPEPRPHQFNSGLQLRNETLNQGRSFPCGDVFAWGEEHGIEGVGVRTALEDSAFADEEKWWQLSIPSFYGFTILVEKAPLSEESHSTLKRLKDSVTTLQSLLAIHEGNRLRLLQGLMETQQHRDNLIKKQEALKQILE